MKTVVTLADYITSHLSTPFEWGKFDCALFVFGWVKQAVGVDFIPDFPPWSHGKQAMRIAKGLGGMGGILDARFERVHPNMAKDGDLAIYQEAAAIFSGAHIVGPGESGLVFVDRTKAEGAWSLAMRIQR